MKKSIFLTAILAATATSTVFAGGSLFGSSSSADNTGAIYGGASVGQATDSTCNAVSDQANALLGNVDCPSPTAWKVFAGYNVAPNIAVEGSYVDFGKADSDFTIRGGIPGNAVANPGSVQTKASGFGVSGVANAPLNEQMSLFGKAGIVAWEAEDKVTVKNVTLPGTNYKQDVTTKSKTDGVDLSLGAGASYKINDNWGVRGEVEHFEGLNANLYSVGATFSTF